MSSYVFVGTEWAGGCPELLNEILRDEWGLRGMVLTDYFGNYGYMDADRAVCGGSDIMLATIGSEAIMTDTKSATSVQAMRTACKNVLYTIVNSNVRRLYRKYFIGAKLKNESKLIKQKHSLNKRTTIFTYYIHQMKTR